MLCLVSSGVGILHKNDDYAKTAPRVQSHPARVRGLKLVPMKADLEDGQVAPRAGAWIETRFSY